jgi:hypothetical protein
MFTGILALIRDLEKVRMRRIDWQNESCGKEKEGRLGTTTAKLTN